MTAPVRFDPRMIAQLETLLGNRPDKGNRAVRWSDLPKLRGALIDAGGAGALDAVDPAAGGGGGGGTTGLDRLNERLELARREIDAAELAADQAMAEAQNVWARIRAGGPLLRAGQTVTLPDGSETAGIESFVWENDGPGPGSAVLLHGDVVIAPGSMSANTYTAGFGNNLIQNSRFHDGMLHWRGVGGGGESTFDFREAGLSYAHPSFRTLMIYQNGVAAANAYLDYAIQQDGTTTRIVGAACRPGQWYGASAYLRAVNSQGRVQIRFFDKAGTQLTNAQSPLGGGIGANDNPDTWERLFVKAPAPANAAYVSIRIVKAATQTGAPDSYLFAWKPQIEETHDKATKPGAYASNETSMMTGDMIYSRTLAGRHLRTDTAIITGLTQMGEATVGNAQITGEIRSDDFVSGPGGRGWRIRKAGDAEFNTVTIRRQIQIDSGTVEAPPVSRSQADPARAYPESPASLMVTTNVPMTAWSGTDATYLAVAGMSGATLSLWGTATGNELWGWVAEVLPLTRWSGAQNIRIGLRFYHNIPNFQSISAHTVVWRLFKVS